MRGGLGTVSPEFGYMPGSYGHPLTERASLGTVRMC
jgi:hypothetical protein